MRCVDEITIRNPRAAEPGQPPTLDVGCGKCYACLSNRRNEWAFRLILEQSVSASVYFVTLTYNELFDEDGVFYDDAEQRSVPVQKSLMQKFHKRLRLIVPTYKHYTIGEYGSTLGRPHYHTMLFFSTELSFDELDAALSATWPYGYHEIGEVTSARLNYILHYHVRPKSVDDRPTFQLFSKGLGKDFIESNLGYYAAHQTVHLNGYPYQLPRYYRKKFDLEYKSDYKHLSLNEYFEKNFGDDFDFHGLVNGLKKIYKDKMKKYNIQEKF